MSLQMHRTCASGCGYTDFPTRLDVFSSTMFFTTNKKDVRKSCCETKPSCLVNEQNESLRRVQKPQWSFMEAIQQQVSQGGVPDIEQGVLD